MAALIEVSRVVVSQGFEVVAYADAAQQQLSYTVESETGQVFAIQPADARTLLDMRLARK
jgi:hypothetical protein